MKIFFLISSLQSGGAERVVSLLANYFSKEHDVTVATFSKQQPFYHLDSRVKHCKLDLLQPSRTILQRVKNSFYRVDRIVAAIKKADPDIIVSFMTQTNFLAVIAAKLTKKPVVIAERIAYDFHGNSVNKIKRVLYPFSNTLVVQTEQDARHYKFLPNVRVVPNPLAIPKIEYVQREPIVLAVGRLEEQKGFDRLIESFAYIQRKDWKLIIAGEGSQRQNLQQLIKKLKLTNVVLVGRRRDIFNLYAKASIFVLSSKKEGFPNVLLEAMAFGCAVVSFDCPYGPSEIIENGVNGILVKNQDTKALASALQKLMDDATLRRRLGDEAMKVRDSYSIEKVAAQWMEIFEDVRSK